MNKRLLILLFTVCAILPFRLSHACSPIQSTSYVKFTDDISHVFVMLRGGHDGLSKHYKASGLYRLDGSRDSVWPVDWVSDSVILHPGGRFLVQMGPKTRMVRAKGARSEPQHYVRGQLYEAQDQTYRNGEPFYHAISFYDNGQLLHEYLLDDLYTDVSKIKYGPCYSVDWRTDYVLDESDNTFKLTTNENISYTFSLSTGEIVSTAKYRNSQYAAIKSKSNRNRINKRSSGLSEQSTEALLDIIDLNWTSAARLGQPFLSDYAMAEKIIGIHGKTYRFFDKTLQDNKRLSHLAVTSGDAINIRALTAHANSKDILSAAVNYDGKQYTALPDKLKNDKKLLLPALRFGGMSIYNAAPKNLRNDREILVTAMRAQLQLMRLGRDARFNLKDLAFIPEQYLEDDRIKRMLDAILEMHSSSYAIPMADIHKEQAYTLIKQTSARQ